MGLRTPNGAKVGLLGLVAGCGLLRAETRALDRSRPRAPKSSVVRRSCLVRLCRRICLYHGVETQHPRCAGSSCRETSRATGSFPRGQWTSRNLPPGQVSGWELPRFEKAPFTCTRRAAGARAVGHDVRTGAGQRSDARRYWSHSHSVGSSHGRVSTWAIRFCAPSLLEAVRQGVPGIASPPGPVPSAQTGFVEPRPRRRSMYTVCRPRSAGRGARGLGRAGRRHWAEPAWRIWSLAGDGGFNTTASRRPPGPRPGGQKDWLSRPRPCPSCPSRVGDASHAGQWLQAAALCPHRRSAHVHLPGGQSASRRPLCLPCSGAILVQTVNRRRHLRLLR